MDRDSPSPHCLPQASVNPEAVSARMGRQGPEGVGTLPAEMPTCSHSAAHLPAGCGPPDLLRDPGSLQREDGSGSA